MERMGSRVLIGAVAGVAAACNVSGTRNPATAQVHFEVRGLTNKETKAIYGGSTFQHEASVVALGDTIAAKRAYLVWFAVKRLAGGDPARPREVDSYAVVLMRNGVGAFTVYGGYRTSSEKWEPERIEVRPLGFDELTSTTDSAVREQ